MVFLLIVIILSLLAGWFLFREAIPSVHQAFPTATRIRWKGSAILFLFLNAAGFAISSPTIGRSLNPNSLDYPVNLDETILVLIFLLGGSLLSSVIFLFSTYRVEERISRNTMNVWWLLKFDIALVMILYIAFLGLGLLYIMIGNLLFSPGGDRDLILLPLLLGGAVIVSVITLFLSFIPALLFYYGYSSEKRFRIFGIFFLVLSFIFAAYGITRLGHYEEYNGPHIQQIR